MNILGMGTLEILVILLIAFIFLGPERMVDAARMLGKVTRELRRMTADVRNEVSDLVREEDFTGQPKRPIIHRDGSPNPTASSANGPANSIEQTDQSPAEEDAPVAFRKTPPVSEEVQSSQQPSKEEQS